MKLIPEAKKWYRLFSMQAMTAVGAGTTAYALLSDEQKIQVLAFFHLTNPAWVVIIGILVAMVSRLLKQRPDTTNETKDDSK